MINISKICSVCGQKNTDDITYCSKCGRNIDQDYEQFKESYAHPVKIGESQENEVLIKIGESRRSESKGLLENLFDLGVDLTIKTGKFIEDVVRDPFVNIERAKGRLEKNKISQIKFQNKKRGYINKLNYYPYDSYDGIKKAKSLLDKNIIDEDDYKEIKKISFKKLHSRNLKSLNLDGEIKIINNLKSTDAVSKEEYKSLIKPYKDQLKRIEAENKRKNAEKIKIQEAQKRRKEEEKRRREREIKERKERELREKEEEKRKKDKELAIQKKLIDSGDDILIKKYASKYEHEIYKLNPLLYNHPIKSDFNKLKELLTSKGHRISDGQLKSLAEKYAHDHHIEIFKQKIFHNSPECLNEILLNYVELYGNNYDSTKIKDLNSLIIKEGYGYTDFDIIEKLQKLIKEKELLRINLNDIDKLSGSEFETFLKILFEKMGYEADKTKGSGDQGADLIINKLGHKIAVQAKRWDGKVTNKSVQEVTAAIAHYNADEGMVITNSTFTQAAIDLADSNDITLIDREKLGIWIKKYPMDGLKIKEV